MTNSVTTFTVVTGKIRLWTFTGELREKELPDQFVLFPQTSSDYVPAVGDIIMAMRPLNWKRQYPHTMRWHNPRNHESFLNLHDREIVSVTVTSIDTLSSRVVFANRNNYGRVLAPITSPSSLENVVKDVQIDGVSIVTDNIANWNATEDASDAEI
jgi:hypothetical protein